MAPISSETTRQEYIAPITLSLRIVEPEVLFELSRHRTQFEQEQFALQALQIGVLAIRTASGEVDTAAIKHLSKNLVSDLEKLFTERGDQMKLGLEEVMRLHLADDAPFPRRINQLVSDSGEIDMLFSAHLHPTESTLAKTLTSYIGDSSPLMQRLSTDEKSGFMADLQTRITGILEEQRRQVMAAFDLHADDSALNRLIKQMDNSNKSLIADLRREFRIEDDNSPIGKLATRLDKAQASITSNLTLDDPGSALARMKRELVELIANMAKDQSAFQLEVKTTLAGLAARKQAERKSQLHGIEFEDQCGTWLGMEVGRYADLFEEVGTHVGKNGRSRVGDFVVTIGSDAAAAGLRIVWEAKASAGYTIGKALEECREARSNRQADVCVMVFRTDALPAGVYGFLRNGCDVLVAWDPTDETSDVMLRAAYSLSKYLLTVQTRENSEFDDMMHIVNNSALQLEREIALVGKAQESCRHLGNHYEDLKKHVNSLASHLKDMKEQLDALLAQPE